VSLAERLEYVGASPCGYLGSQSTFSSWGHFGLKCPGAQLQIEWNMKALDLKSRLGRRLPVRQGIGQVTDERLVHGQGSCHRFELLALGLLDRCQHEHE
jgi:hypothetical protein